jgi:phytoene dehydrogenase-like protein
VPARHVYDAIVLGGQVGAALAAALLSRRGRKVLLVPQDGLGARYEHQGFRFSHGPSLTAPLDALPLLARVASELSVGPRLEALVRQPALQLLQPGEWFELRGGDKERAVELKRALGAGADAFSLQVARAVTGARASDAFLEAGLDFPPEGMLARWRLTRQLPRFTGLSTPCPLPADAFLRTLLPFVTQVDRASPMAEARGLGHVLAGPSALEGGREALYQLLAERAFELGADVVGPDERVEELVVQGASAVGVRLRNLGATYRAQALIAGCDLEVLAPLAAEARRGPARRALGRLTSATSVLTVHSVLPALGLPPGLGTLALVPADGPGSLLVEVSGATRVAAGLPSAAPLRTLTVSTVISTAPRPTEASVRTAVASVWKALEAVLPFTRAHVQVESIPMLHAPAVTGLGEPWPLFSTPPDSWFGLTGHLTQPTWGHLLLASRQVFPGLGLEGEVLAAVRAVERAERLTGASRKRAG